MRCSLYETLALLVLCALNWHGALGNNDEDSWIQPNAWAREHHLAVEAQIASAVSKGAGSGQGNGDTATTSESPPIGEMVAFVYYKKLIANLLHREKLVYDETNAVFRRSVVFTLLPAQLEQLERLSDVRDIDSVLTEVLTNVRAPEKADFIDDRGGGGVMGIVALFVDILKDLLQLLTISEFRFATIVVTLLLLGWLAHRRYHVGIISMIVGGILVFGYFHTYLECNRKLEAERMLEALERHQPVEELKPRWYSPILGFLTWNEPAKQTRQDFIKQNSKLNLAFCRPDHVLMQYANDLFLTQLEILIEKCIDTFITLRASLPFPFNYVAPIILVVLITYVLKLIFKYILSPRAWAALLHTNAINANYRQQQQHALASDAAALEDRISGENLRKLLSCIGSSGPNMFVVNNSTQPVTGSGVEEVREQLETAPASSEAKSTPSKAPKISVTEQQSDQCNNNTESCVKDCADELGSSAVRLEDLNDDANA